MFERFTRAARDVVVRAQEEATALGHEHVGTEHLLLALSALDAGVAGGVLRALRVDHDALRDEVIALLGPDRLDADALATIGIDLDQVRRSVEASFGAGALSPAPGLPPRRPRWLPAADPAREAGPGAGAARGARPRRSPDRLRAHPARPDGRPRERGRDGAATRRRASGQRARRDARRAAARRVGQGAGTRSSAFATKWTAAASRSVNERMCSQQVSGPSGSSNSPCSSSGATAPASR